MDAGYYWATIKHTGEMEVIEVWDWCGMMTVTRMGEEQTLELDQVEIIEAIPRPAHSPRG